MEKQGKDDETTIENNFYFRSKAITITNKNDIGNALQYMSSIEEQSSENGVSGNRYKRAKS